MKGFLGDIIVKKLAPYEWELLGDLSYENYEIKVTAKSGMPTDFASVPRFFWRVVGTPAGGEYSCSALIHDALYTARGLAQLTKEQVDDLFLEMLKVEGVSYWKRYAMYWAVRLGGREAWDSIEENGGKYCEISFINTIK